MSQETDIQSGTDGPDTLTALASGSTLNGLGGNDQLIGGSSDDTFNGGDGRDSAYYHGATAGVTVDLNSSGPQDTVGAGTDALTSIENLIGSAFNDTLTGVDGSAFAPASTLIGADGDDTLTGGSYHYGGDGNDTLNGTTGTMFLNGGAGDDTLNANGNGSAFADYSDNATGVTVSLALDGIAQNTVGAGMDTLNGILMLNGSAHDDTLTGNAGNNQIYGGLGDDVLDGGAGFDFVGLGAGSGPGQVDLAITGPQDTGAFGVDTIVNFENISGSFAYGDTLSGDGGANTIYGWGGADILNGRGGDDTLLGLAGSDTLDGGAGGDTAVFLGALANYTITHNTVGGVTTTTVVDNRSGSPDGTDTLTNVETFQFADGSHDAASLGVDIQTGTDGPDTLTALASGSTLNGLGGGDTLTGGAGDDAFDGGAGNDTVSYTAAAAGVTVDLNSGGAQDTVGAGTDTLVSIESVTGSAFNDTLTGVDGIGLFELVNTVNGGAGDDTLTGGSFLYGGDGNDTLNGTTGVMFLNGGAGDDTLNANGNGSVFADYSDNATSVTVSLALDGIAQNTVGAGMDTLNGIAQLNGSAHNDTLTGNGADNQIYGGLGDDVLDGGAGFDFVGLGAGSGPGQVDLEITGPQDTGSFGVDTIVNFEAISGSFAYGDTLSGDGGANTIYGWGGDDILNGRGGDDVLHAGFGADTIDGGAGVDTVGYWGVPGPVTVDLALSGPQNTGPLGVDTITNVENVQGSFDYGNTISGDSGDNGLYGGGGDDILNGRGGDDTLIGGAGNDTASYTDATSGVSVNLSQTAAQAVGGGQGADTLVSIENLIGSGYSDTLTAGASGSSLSGGAGDDHLTGGAGDDAFDGGAGNDTAVFTGQLSDYTVTDSTVGGVTTTTVVDNRSGSPDGTDTLINVESLGFADVVQLSDSGVSVVFDANQSAGTPQQIHGGAGDDTLDIVAPIVLPPGGVSVAVSADGTSIVFDFDGDGVTDLTVSAVEEIKLSGQHIVLTGDFSGTGLAAHTITYTGGTGNDLFDASGMTSSEEVVASGFDGDDTLKSGAGPDRLDGGAGNDTLVGGAGADTLDGGADNDSLDGGAGADTASYVNATSGVTLNLNKSKAQAVGGGQGTDTLVSIENLIGSAFNDTLTGIDGISILNGGGGDDVLTGGSVINGGDGDDTLIGKGGDDILGGGTGNDTLKGGGGHDTATYFDAASAVTVNLAITDGQNTGSAGTDTLTSISNLTGSDFADTLTGDNGANVLSGGLGDDILTGGGGLDSLFGGLGNDAFVFTALKDSAKNKPDLILDFTAGDLIDLHLIDADTKSAGDQAFHLGGGGGHAGDITAVYDAMNDRTVLSLFVDNNASVDSVIWLAGDHHLLTPTDFVL